MSAGEGRTRRYGMVIDVDRCTGCGACMIACAVENNVPPVPPAADESKGITWMRVYRARAKPGAGGEAFFPVSCQHCDNAAPCETVCPQLAVETDRSTGIVTQIPSRCLGCRYCMAACPYHARYFNWWDPLPAAAEPPAMNPDVSPRMRGVVEKCNLCHGRLQAARARAAAEGRGEPRPDEHVPACAEACPAGAIVFGDLDDPEGPAARLARDPRAFRLLDRLGTEPKIYYLSSREWVRKLGETVLERSSEEPSHG